MRDIATADDWKEMLTEIKRTDKSIEDILGDWSKKTVQEIHAEITSMKREVERQLNIVLDTINVRYMVFGVLLSTRHNLINGQSRLKQLKINWISSIRLRALPLVLMNKLGKHVLSVLRCLYFN